MQGQGNCFAIVMAKDNIKRQAENQGQLQAKSMSQKSNHVEIELLSKEVRSMLAAHRGMLKVPTTLPPPKEFDHKIWLVDKTKLINVPPNKYAHFQKWEIE